MKINNPTHIVKLRILKKQLDEHFQEQQIEKFLQPTYMLSLDHFSFTPIKEPIRLIIKNLQF